MTWFSILLVCATGCHASAAKEGISMPGTIGTKAPNVDLQLHDGSTVKLSDFENHQSVVLFFYPKDNTPVCTSEACSFRDAYQDFESLNAMVIGISSDTQESHKGFAEKYTLPYLLASDPDGDLRTAFGVSRTLGILPGRTTYVIDQNGIIRLAFSSQFSAAKHVQKAKETLRELKLTN
jgi:peroxiredoxin Q/BCP